MSSGEGVYEIFTDINVLRSREPEYFELTETLIATYLKLLVLCELLLGSSKNVIDVWMFLPIPIAIGPDNLPVSLEGDEETGTSNTDGEAVEGLGKGEGTPMFSTMASADGEKFVSDLSAEGVTEQITQSAQTLNCTKNAVSILQEGCQRWYDGDSPKYELDERIVGPAKFAVRCEIRGLKALGVGRKKKAAKQNAAQQILRMIIEKGRYDEFGLGKTAEEAYNFVETLTDDILESEPLESTKGNTVRQENFIGKLNSLCQQNEWLAAQFTLESEGPTNNCIFTAECKLGNLTAEGKGKKKKIIERSSEEELKANGLQLKNSSELKSRETEDSPNSACDILENSLNESLELPSESSVVSEETSAQMHERCDNSVTQEKLGSSTEISGSKVGQQ
ncbi:unnamed protein product [Enterobius vermicularis]|uniref:DRBM domain-containing protein n=1 Tax=Enterobius vermicularis TaxID=51028 RepID=A0A0N4VR60_ENTVE|nr:unnamed protein product [Enterobius vermicularis]